MHPAERPVKLSRHGPSPAAARRTDARFLPTLFDRLMDDEPSDPVDRSGRAGLDRVQMRELIRRDIAFILNTVNHDERIDRALHPRVAGSCINYGLPPLAGNWVAVRRGADVRRLIRRALLDFEPRLLPHSLEVTSLASGRLASGAPDAGSHNVLLFEISGQMQLSAEPFAFRLRSSVDLETSHVTLLP